MKLENNGKLSSGKRTRHINICYFFITDRIKSGEAAVKYCPTEMMIGDFYTKPLQGSLFKVFRDLILNINDPNVSNYAKAVASGRSLSKIKPLSDTKVEDASHILTSQECVEKNGLKNETKNKLPIRKKPINKNGDFLGIKGYENSTRDLVNSKMPNILQKLSTLYNTTSRIL